jgi:hypothetical protein
MDNTAALRRARQARYLPDHLALDSRTQMILAKPRDARRFKPAGAAE